MKEELQTGHHPDADQLSAFVERALPAHEREQMLTHLAACPDCRAVVALSLPEIDESKQAEKPRSAWFTRWTLAWSAAVAVTALIVFIVYLNRMPPGGTKTAAPTQMARIEPPAKPEANQQTAAAPNAPAAPEAKARSISRGVPSVGKVNKPAKRDQKETAQAQRVAGLEVQGRNTAENMLQTAPPPAMTGSAEQQAPARASNTEAGAMGALKTGGTSGSGAGNVNAALAVPGAPPAGTLNAPVGGPGLAEAKLIPAPQPLPSGMPVLSMATLGGRMLAIDTRNAAFLSEDGGDHWSRVQARWKGKAVSATLVSYNAEGGAPAKTGGFFKAEAAPASVTGTVLGLKSAPLLTGIVTDVTGAVIPAASVIVTAADGKNTRTVSTDDKGRYRLEGLAPGVYRVKVEARGFESRTLNDMTVGASMRSVANVSLAVGASAQTVMVEAESQPITDEAIASKARKKAAKPLSAEPPTRVFEITTDKGQRWTSSDGMTWARK